MISKILLKVRVTLWKVYGNYTITIILGIWTYSLNFRSSKYLLSLGDNTKKEVNTSWHVAFCTPYEQIIKFEGVDYSCIQTKLGSHVQINVGLVMSFCLFIPFISFDTSMLWIFDNISIFSSSFQYHSDLYTIHESSYLGKIAPISIWFETVPT